MHITLVSGARFPFGAYGGTERVVAWLAREFARAGHRVTLLCRPGSRFEGVDLRFATDVESALAALPADSDIVHFHGWFPPPPHAANWVFTLHGNTKDLASLPRQTICISRDHAARHGRSVVVYNGVDPDELTFKDGKAPNLLFFSKIRRRVKGAGRALRLAEAAGEPITFAGGTRADLLKNGTFVKSFRPGVRVLGEISGAAKARAFAEASALLFPIDWDEPFGLVLIEALLSGTPVVATPRGAVPELIPPGVGALFTEDAEFPAALAKARACPPADCRDWAESHFTSATMARNYVTVFERLLDGEDVFAPQP